MFCFDWISSYLSTLTWRMWIFYSCYFFSILITVLYTYFLRKIILIFFMISTYIPTFLIIFSLFFSPSVSQCYVFLHKVTWISSDENNTGDEANILLTSQQSHQFTHEFVHQQGVNGTVHPYFWWHDNIQGILDVSKIN